MLEVELKQKSYGQLFLTHYHKYSLFYMPISKEITALKIEWHSERVNQKICYFDFVALFAKEHLVQFDILCFLFRLLLFVFSLFTCLLTFLVCLFVCLFWFGLFVCFSFLLFCFVCLFVCLFVLFLFCFYRPGILL